MTRENAQAFLKKAEEYLSSAQDSVDMERYTVAAGDSIHAGISAKDAIVTMLTGSTGKSKDHMAAVRELHQALGRRDEASSADRALRELLAAKPDVEYSVTVMTSTKATAMVRRAQTLVALAIDIVRLGR